MTAKPMNCSRRCPIRSMVMTASSVAGNGEDHENRQRPQQLRLERGRGIDLFQDRGQREGVAVVGVVEEEPAPAVPSEQRQHPAVGEELAEAASVGSPGRTDGRVDHPVGERGEVRAAWSASPWTWALNRGDSGIFDPQVDDAAAGIAPRPSMSRQVSSWLIPEESNTSPTSGPTIRPRACMENTMPTRRPRSFAVRVLAHEHGRDRIVAADAEAEHEAAITSQMNRGQGRGQGADDHDHRHDQVDPLRPSTSAMRPKTNAPKKAPRMAEPVTQLVCSVLRCHWVATMVATVLMTKRS